MEFKTKYNLGDSVVAIQQNYDLVFEPCSLCSGSGKVRVVGSDKKAVCPVCEGAGGNHVRKESSWHVCDQAKITNVFVEFHRDEETGSVKTSEEYMMQPSVTLHEVVNLFRTKTEALNECKKRNGDDDE